MAKTTKTAWAFVPRFRRHAFGWRSQPAVRWVREAVSEIKQVARRDPMLLSAEGAVLFLEKVSPALAHVDSSSGAIGTAGYLGLLMHLPLPLAAVVHVKRRLVAVHHSQSGDGHNLPFTTMSPRRGVSVDVADQNAGSGQPPGRRRCRPNILPPVAWVALTGAHGGGQWLKNHPFPALPAKTVSCVAVGAPEGAVIHRFCGQFFCMIIIPSSY